MGDGELGSAGDPVIWSEETETWSVEAAAGALETETSSVEAFSSSVEAATSSVDRVGSADCTSAVGSPANGSGRTAPSPTTTGAG